MADSSEQELQELRDRLDRIEELLDNNSRAYYAGVLTNRNIPNTYQDFHVTLIVVWDDKEDCNATHDETFVVANMSAAKEKLAVFTQRKSPSKRQIVIAQATQVYKNYGDFK